MDISLMVEGQNGLTWDKWSNILRRSEDAGLSGVFRSDHFFIGTQQDSLEPYLSFTMAALQTERIRFGPLVTPVTFRPPVNVGRMAAQLDQLSNGRFVMGLGGGWNESEHVAYGVPFPPVGERLSRLEEAIHVMRGLWGPGPASYEGRFYTLKDADCLPKPPVGRPTLLIGGAASGAPCDLPPSTPTSGTASACSLTPTPTRSRCCRPTATPSAATPRR